MKFTLLFLSFFFFNAVSQPGERKVISRAALADKVKGGWAGQYFGASSALPPPAFASSDSARIGSNAATILSSASENVQRDFKSNLYTDLLYLTTIAEHGTDKIQAPLSKQLGTSDFLIGHAIQTAGYNLRGGLHIASSGRWTNNPHAEDPDFAKAAEVLGLLSPAMPHTASRIAEPIGHITNTGEGYYGGLYIASLHSLAFRYSRPAEVVDQAIRNLPEKSEYRKCLEDVVLQSQLYPNEWSKNWKYLSREWKKHTGCPFNPSVLESDARIYTAFATLIFLAGDGDLNKTLVVASAFPESSQVLPAVFSLLGVMNGFESFPADWKLQFESIADLKFEESLPTFNEACSLTLTAAVKAIEANGGKEKKDGDIVIRVQRPSAHGFERGFDGHFIAKVQPFNTRIVDQFEFDFEGVGFVLRADQTVGQESEDVAFAELYLNNKYIDRIAIPFNKNHSAADLCWRFQLPHKKYRAKIKLLKPSKAPLLTVTDLVVYDVMPAYQ